MERLINILIIDEKDSDRSALKEILGGGGNILLFCDSVKDAHEILKRREVGIILIDVDSPNFSSMEISEGTIKSRLFYATKYLAQGLKEYQPEHTK